MLSRPRAPTPSTISATPDDWNSDYEPQSPGVSPSSGYVVNTPPSMLTPPPVISSHSLSALGYTAFSSTGNDEDGALSDSGYSHSSHPSTSTTTLPDPSQFPDPYPYRPSRWHLGSATPALSSADSSSASTRSSAYTGSAKSGDYGHVNVALGGEDEATRGVGVGITTDDIVQLKMHESGAPSSATQGRAPIDQGRWSDHYANGMRSRSSSLANSKAESSQDKPLPVLRGTPSFDMGWQRPDERDEAGIGSEDDLDDDPSFDDDEDVDDAEVPDEPTSAALMAEEGRGVIVRGDDAPIMRLQVQPDTTHLLIGSSTTPNTVPSFLANTLPQISSCLLALDISANFLGALPPALSGCVNLEELNIAYNPLRALPTFLATLSSLRVLIVDSTGISTLPESLASLEMLHTLSIRRNKMHSLPSWLCELTALETLLVDGNPFQGPWKALMEPLLSRSPLSPGMPPSTPMFPLHSASIRSTTTATTDDGYSDELSPRVDHVSHEEEDLTVTSPRAPPALARSITAPPSGQSNQLPSPGLSRTRTTPNRAYYDKSRTSSKGPKSMFSEAGPSDFSRAAAESEKEVRRMKSAGELRRNAQRTPPASSSSSPQRGALGEYGGSASASSSNLLSIASSSSQDSQSVPRRFASLGVASGAMSPTMSSRSRRTVDSSIWDSPTEEETLVEPVPPLPNKVIFPQEGAYAMDHALPPRPRMKEDKDKSSRWGFLKKMSMGKMRTDQPPPLSRSSMHQSQVPLHQQSPFPSRPPPPRQMVSTPLLDVRISTTGTLLQQPEPADELPIMPSISRKHSNDLLKLTASPLDQLKKMSNEAAKQAPTGSSNSLLVPGGLQVTSRANKRRSFLPIDVSPIPIPAASQFVPGVTATNSEEQEESMLPAPSPVQRSPVQPENTYEELQRREEERAREARIRALRSVMSYLKDMHDLTRSQTQTLSLYGLASLDSQSPGTRSRRPTMVDNGRLNENPTASIMSGGSSSRPDSVNLRSTEGRIGSTTQTNSVATTDSTGSGGGEEKKYKDDKAKRSRIIREIVETERTYVKGLQELVDIYIRPASAPISGLSGVQNKDTIVPAQERKIVFSGLEALFYFHRESFLPALERAAAPLLSPTQTGDLDGQLSLYVARDVANTFVSHAAFMKMYSTYINNFDNSVQRIKMWTTDKPGPAAPAQTLSPSTSSSQLVGLGLAMSAGIGNAGALDNAPSNNAVTLSSSQRKRIKQYLKRCRMNPRHSQLNLEGYLLLPVQRVPRYRLLLEELTRASPPLYEHMDDPIDRALNEIASVATNMNEGKRDAETRRKLVQWQSRIRGKFPSPLVQPHR
ncbi:Myosin-M heavy chain [Trametes pubescens]|uniref:Myosin-M heavy chain n=1 Tax=Trametes pubescens TaxID=154538 RepID=A0A1M2VH50_TRAPU|nr:Myosin-M heavy chain [Trametes pubescens]